MPVHSHLGSFKKPEKNDFAFFVLYRKKGGYHPVSPPGPRTVRFYSITILLLLSDIKIYMSIMELSIYSMYGNLKVLVSDMLNISKVSSGSGELSEIDISSVFAERSSERSSSVLSLRIGPLRRAGYYSVQG